MNSKCNPNKKKAAAAASTTSSSSGGDSTLTLNELAKMYEK